MISMEYLKTKNLLDNEANQLSRLKTKFWIQIDDESPGTYNVNNEIKFKTKMLKSSFLRL